MFVLGIYPFLKTHNFLRTSALGKYPRILQPQMETIVYIYNKLEWNTTGEREIQLSVFQI